MREREQEGMTEARLRRLRQTKEERSESFSLQSCRRKSSFFILLSYYHPPSREFYVYRLRVSSHFTGDPSVYLSIRCLLVFLFIFASARCFCCCFLSLLSLPFWGKSSLSFSAVREKSIDRVFGEFGRLRDIEIHAHYVHLHYEDRRSAAKAIEELNDKEVWGARVRRKMKRVK